MDPHAISPGFRQALAALIKPGPDLPPAARELARFSGWRVAGPAGTLTDVGQAIAWLQEAGYVVRISSAQEQTLLPQVDSVADDELLLPLARAAENGTCTTLGFELTRRGLLRGIDDAAFLEVRANLKPPWELERARRSLVAAMELARAQARADLVERISEAMRGLPLTPDMLRMPASEVEAVLAFERDSEGFSPYRPRPFHELEGGLMEFLEELFESGSGRHQMDFDF